MFSGSEVTFGLSCCDGFCCSCDVCARIASGLVCPLVSLAAAVWLFAIPIRGSGAVFF